MIKSNSEFLQYAMNNYDNPHLSFISEFEYDIKRFTTLNNLITRYRENRKELNTKLIVNHIITLENLFTLPVLLHMFEYKIIEDNKGILDTFLFYMNKIDVSKYNLDFNLLRKLNEE